MLPAAAAPGFARSKAFLNVRRRSLLRLGFMAAGSSPGEFTDEYFVVPEAARVAGSEWRPMGDDSRPTH